MPKLRAIWDPATTRAPMENSRIKRIKEYSDRKSGKCMASVGLIGKIHAIF